MMWSIVFVNTIRAINICIIKLCSKLFLGSLNMVGCYIMRRSLAKKVVYKKIKIIGFLNNYLCYSMFLFLVFGFFLTF
jgi:hypothetical protein